MIYKKNIPFFIVLFFYFSISMFLYSSNQYSKLSNEYEVNNYNGRIAYANDYERREDGSLYLLGEKEKYSGRIIGTNSNGKVEKILNVSNGQYDGKAYYYQNGKLKNQREFKNGLILELIEYAENEKNKTYIYKNIQDNMGEIIVYHKNGRVKAQSIAYIEDYVKNGENRFKFLYDGLGKYYDEKGNLAGEMVLDKNKTYGNEMKLYYPNGNVQYYAIMGDSVKEYIDKIIEYYDNGQIKQDCTETSGSWSCLTYSKDGTYKGTAQGKPKTYSNLWVNIGLAFLNVLF